MAAVLPWSGFLEHLDGRERLLAAMPAGTAIRHAAWSPDGSKLAYTVQTGLLSDIWMLTMGDPPVTTPFLSRTASEHSPAFSPDGRWLAYVSDESGRFEVYSRIPRASGWRCRPEAAAGRCGGVMARHFSTRASTLVCRR